MLVEFTKLFRNKKKNIIDFVASSEKELKQLYLEHNESPVFVKI